MTSTREPRSGTAIDPTMNDSTSMTVEGDLSCSRHENPPPSEKGRFLQDLHLYLSQPSSGQANFGPKIAWWHVLQAQGE